MFRKAMQRRQEEAQKAEHLLGVFGVRSEE